VVDGSCAEAFAPLRDLLEKNLASGDDMGASLAVAEIEAGEQRAAGVASSSAT
jgi:hypothetical protein